MLCHERVQSSVKSAEWVEITDQAHRAVKPCASRTDTATASTNVRLAGHAIVRVHTGNGRDTRTDLFQHRRATSGRTTATPPPCATPAAIVDTVSGGRNHRRCPRVPPRGSCSCRSPLVGVLCREGRCDRLVHQRPLRPACRRLRQVPAPASWRPAHPGRLGGRLTSSVGAPAGGTAFAQADVSFSRKDSGAPGRCSVSRLAEHTGGRTRLQLTPFCRFERTRRTSG